MSELKTAINVVEIIIGILIVLIAGDWLGYKIGRMRLAGWVGGICLAVIIIFVIYAMIALA